MAEQTERAFLKQPKVFLSGKISGKGRAMSTQKAGKQLWLEFVNGEEGEGMVSMVPNIFLYNIDGFVQGDTRATSTVKGGNRGSWRYNIGIENGFSVTVGPVLAFCLFTQVSLTLVTKP
ncbi:hypothetical protein L7F22_001807 [Adiantum nelumboides]|nr:hypothetical protein [Adiantum nelumboides]